MRKIISIILAAVMLLSVLSGCNQKTVSDHSEKLNIVTTIFPQYDWVRQILGDQAENAEITMLLDHGVDLHSYQPTADDMIQISTCDLFIYVGGESDSWVEDALAEARNEDMVVINLMEVLGDAVKEEEIVEGMEHDHEHHEEGHDHEHHDEEEHGDEHHEEEGHDHEHHEEDDHDHEHHDGGEHGEEHHKAEHEDEQHGEEEHENDEHVWLSLKNAEVICSYIAQQLGKIDTANRDAYIKNAENYIALLAKLDSAYKAVVDGAFSHTLLFGDRFPFRYLADDYGISYYAAFSGCSAQTEASFETIAFLAGKVDELGLTSVMTIEGGDYRIAETVIRNTAGKNQSILTLNSMQSVTSKEIEAGITYLSIMEDNLEVLKDALN